MKEFFYFFNLLGIPVSGNSSPILLFACVILVLTIVILLYFINIILYISVLYVLEHKYIIDKLTKYFYLNKLISFYGKSRLYCY